MNVSGLGSGWPDCGLRACRCTIAAPASEASTAEVAISAGETGRCGDMVGVWIPPVTAQVMITDFANFASLSKLEHNFRRS